MPRSSGARMPSAGAQASRRCGAAISGMTSCLDGMTDNMATHSHNIYYGIYNRLWTLTQIYNDKQNLLIGALVVIYKKPVEKPHAPS